MGAARANKPTLAWSSWRTRSGSSAMIVMWVASEPACRSIRRFGRSSRFLECGAKGLRVRSWRKPLCLIAQTLGLLLQSHTKCRIWFETSTLLHRTPPLLSKRAIHLGADNFTGSFPERESRNMGSQLGKWSHARYARAFGRSSARTLRNVH
jgi:hypothetical protein